GKVQPQAQQKCNSRRPEQTTTKHYQRRYERHPHHRHILPSQAPGGISCNRRPKGGYRNRIQGGKPQEKSMQSSSRGISCQRPTQSKRVGYAQKASQDGELLLHFSDSLCRHYIPVLSRRLSRMPLAPKKDSPEKVVG